jgi:hypothetical protein
MQEKSPGNHFFETILCRRFPAATRQEIHNAIHQYGTITGNYTIT